jgi:hypothetical protein
MVLFYVHRLDSLFPKSKVSETGTVPSSGIQEEMFLLSCATLWSSGQSFWLQIPRSRIRFPDLQDFLRSRGSETASTQLRGDNWRATWMKQYRLRSTKPKLRAVGIRCANHETSSIRKNLALTSPTSGGRSVGIVRLRTTATEFSF